MEITNTPHNFFFQIIVIVFVVCSTQALLAFIFDAVYVGWESPPEWLQIYIAIVNLLVIINSAANFFVFYLFGKKFRMLLGRVFKCGSLQRKGFIRQGWVKRSYNNSLQGHHNNETMTTQLNEH